MCLFFLILFFCFINCVFTSTERYVLPFKAKEFQLIKSFSTKHSFISVVQRNNVLYIVKQKKNPKNIAWSIIQTVIADRIASSTRKISTQHVYIIPKEMKFPGKVFPNEAASFHTIVPGISVQRWQMNMGKIEKDEMRELIRKFSIKQHPKINISIIRCSAKHNDLPFILALHTLLGFYDGHKKNIFYDVVTDRFSIIDMDCSYKVNLASRAYKCMEKLFQNHNITQKSKIKDALLEFAHALECIMDRNPIENLSEMVTEIALAMTYKEKSIVRHQCNHRKDQIEMFLRESYEVAHNIVNLIKQTYLT